MSRDYKTHKPAKSGSEKGGSAFFGGFVGYALGLASAIAIWLYLSFAPSPFLQSEKAAVPTEKSDSTPAIPSKLIKPVPEEPQQVVEEKPRFDFYKILPGIDEPEIDPANVRKVEERPVLPAVTKTPEPQPKIAETPQPPVQVVPQPAPPIPQQSAAIPPRMAPIESSQPVTPQSKNPKSTEKYLLQVGSFKKNDDAENMKARLALLGIMASIQTIDLAEKGVFYRVRVGPFTKKEDVDETTASLKENGISAQFIKVQ